jgi:putative membrane protein
MTSRRGLMAGFAAVATSSAFAQNSPREQGASFAPSLESQHIQKTAALSALSLATSRIAGEKIALPRLKEFAALEVVEQLTVVDVLKTLADPQQLNGTVPQPDEGQVEAQLDPRGSEIVQRMRTAPAGTDFNREYFLLQVGVHQQLLRIQEDYLKLGRSPGSIIFTKLVHGMISEHLQFLADIKNELGTGTPIRP